MADPSNAAPDSTEVKARALGRVAGRMLGSNRVVNAGIQGVSATAKATSRAARVLWLEVTGFFFTVFALVMGGATVREYKLYSTGQIGQGKVAAGIFFTLMFAYFSATAFWKSRKQK